MGVVPVASHSYLEWNGAEPCWTVPCCNAPRKAHAARVSATVRWPRSPPDPGAKERRNEGSMSSHSTLSSIGKGVHEESAAESACIQCLSKLRWHRSHEANVTDIMIEDSCGFSVYSHLWAGPGPGRASSLAFLIASWLNKGWYLSPLIVWCVQTAIVYSHAVSLYRLVGYPELNDYPKA